MDTSEFDDRGMYDAGFFHLWVDTDEDVSQLQLNTSELKGGDWTSSFLHEYIHFLQDITTTHGLLNLCHAVEYIKGAVKQITLSAEKEFNVPLAIPDSFNWNLNRELKRIYRGEEEPSMPPRHGIDYLRYSSKMLDLVDKDGAPISVTQYYIHYLDVGAQQPMSLHFGSVHLKEYMSHAIQCQFDPDTLHEVFPYSIVERVVAKEVPQLAEDRLLLIALCDASLMYYHPAGVFFEVLERLKMSKSVPSNVDSIYEFVFEVFKIGGSSGEHANDLFKRTTEMATKQFQDCLSHPFFNDDVIWFKELMDQAFSWRFRRRGFLATLVDGPSRISNTCKEAFTAFGIPFTTNRLCRGFFAAPPKLIEKKIDSKLLKTFQAISHTFSGRPGCSMFPICSRADEDKASINNVDVPCCETLEAQERMTDERCQSKPWERLTPGGGGCPYTTLWRLWGLEGKIPTRRK